MVIGYHISQLLILLLLYMIAPASFKKFRPLSGKWYRISVGGYWYSYRMSSTMVRNSNMLSYSESTGSHSAIPESASISWKNEQITSTEKTISYWSL